MDLASYRLNFLPTEVGGQNVKVVKHRNRFLPGDWWHMSRQDTWRPWNDLLNPLASHIFPPNLNQSFRYCAHDVAGTFGCHEGRAERSSIWVQAPVRTKHGRYSGRGWEVPGHLYGGTEVPLSKIPTPKCWHRALQWGGNWSLCTTTMKRWRRKGRNDAAQQEFWAFSFLKSHLFINISLRLSCCADLHMWFPLKIKKK